MDPVSFLLVDDLEENLISLEALLRREGLRLLKARSGDEALELLLKHDIALALIDVQMPGMNGFELAELMRGNERSRRVPIIFVTAGSPDRSWRFQGYEAGAVDFIQKPIEPDILRSKAEVFFELYRQRQQLAMQRDELEAHATALKEADQRKDIFLATLAHELRNPLAPLRHGLDILNRKPDSAEAEKIRSTMDRQLSHLVRLIDDLLDVSRVSQGKIELRREPIKVQDIVNLAVEGSRPAIDAAGHRFVADLPSEALWVDGDPARLSQVVGNLLNNAAKYTPAGGRIEITAYRETTEVVIVVSDNGIGIPEHMRSNVFLLFTQVEDHLTRSQGGLGIGLSLSKQLVTLHGGRIEAKAGPTGTGTSFVIRLPLVSAPAETTPEARPSVDETVSEQTGKVLIVDDNVDVAQVVGWMVEEIGYEYHLVHDGREALQAARSFQPDIVLLDIGLPHMDGYEVCRAFRADGEFKDIPIIAQTGWGQSKDKDLASAAGFNHHLTKPVDLDELGSVLGQIVRDTPRAQ
ncbi:response regulator [Rhizobium sp. BK661]|uniref:response regulator n=1 Tax=Rhizobium sp. BK661 TaxID=2586991 RepID=UPI002167D561|nr:response regulator [Rhizobium sp. BK661]MCS3744148.1 signal transduction histidine kinase [Rhizobium sp. BK661]